MLNLDTLMLPFGKKGQRIESKRVVQLITQKDMPFYYVEAYKSLRTNIQFLTGSAGVRSIVVTSTIPEEAKSNTVANLAMALSEAGRTVVLVDCDLRKPVMHKYLKIGHNTRGVSNVLSGQCTMEEAIVHLEGSSVYVLPAGTLPPNPSELLSQKQMEALVRRLRASFDYVIIDAPPISVVTDAAIIGRMVDGALYVVRSQFVPAKAVQTSVAKLRDAGVNVLGTVITRYNPKTSLKSSGYSYTYSYDYNYSGQASVADSDDAEEHKRSVPV